MAYHLNIIFLVVGALQGALVSFFLLRKKASHPSIIFLILFLIVVGIQLAFKVASKAWLWDNVRLIYQLTYSLPFLIGPALYFFVKSRIQNVTIRWMDLLHLLPFVFRLMNNFIDSVYGVAYFPFTLWSILPWPSFELISLY